MEGTGGISAGEASKIRISDSVIKNSNIGLSSFNGKLLDYLIGKTSTGPRHLLHFPFAHDIHPEIILELKYPIELDVCAAQVSQGFNFRLSRESNYVQGMTLLHNDL